MAKGGCSSQLGARGVLLHDPKGWAALLPRSVFCGPQGLARSLPGARTAGRKQPVPLERLRGTFTRPDLRAQTQCRCYGKCSAKQSLPPCASARFWHLASCFWAFRSPNNPRIAAPARQRAWGTGVRVPGGRPSSLPPQRLPLPWRARPVPVPGGGPSCRGAASPSPPAFPAARPPPAGLQGLPPCSSGRDIGSERTRGRAEAARCGVAALREARGDTGPLSAFARSFPASRTPLAPTPFPA